ncbi:MULTISPECIES: enoyl-CoA hydratase family protein [unclassified Kitasatospora]|uniref:enoyl-CoA hydratase family protein n=1 Tax=unclassified Kitasatospora TaxID=2633591 RepID=UPI000710EBDF|nr:MULTISPECIES: enoyl-CoA hydratase family protein [unclassified Kitasatospora]KQV16554.1 enoyl-CoA hydratase [Kitasatospora sp. Root107]KRB71582.1 enoyl-CoA hydratase [Kitasatospora sp. Root187]
MTREVPFVRVSTVDAVTTLELDSPHNRNALSSRLMAELTRGLADAAADPAVRAVVLGHTGKVFCAGADLTEATGADPTVGPRGLVDLQRAIVDCPKPVVALVNGHVRAGGLGLLGAADLVVAGPLATFAFTEVRLGLAPAVISLPLRPKLDPRAASRYYLTGETFDAAEAARIGLITEAADDPSAAAKVLLDAFRLCSPQGLAESKRLANAEVVASFERDADERVTQSARLFGSAEAQQGMRAFLERRPAPWAE